MNYTPERILKALYTATFASAVKVKANPKIDTFQELCNFVNTQQLEIKFSPRRPIKIDLKPEYLAKLEDEKVREELGVGDIALEFYFLRTSYSVLLKIANYFDVMIPDLIKAV
jgi:hypothetical protein